MVGVNVVPSQMLDDKRVVGLEDEQEIIRDKLTRGTSDLDVVSIVGMGGLGKTTMARKAYQELDYHFHVRAFCCISQTYDKRKLLLKILSQVTQLPDETKEMSFQDLGECLCRGLKGRRYLIVIDDLWNIAAWNVLECFFPNDRNQSRILITSRQNDVVSQVKQGAPPYCLRFLSEEESWELLEEEVFHQGHCPPDLLDLGRKIAVSCQGLPLAIVVVAGILARMGQEGKKWEQIALNVSTHAQIECSHIFDLSYMYLPQHLKRCFLYLAAFQEDFRIPVRKLIQLWIAEGLIPRTGNQHLEDLAEDYLKDLVSWNLVMVSERRSIGGIKKCHLHDLMREFCLRKAHEETFMRQLQVHEYGWRFAFLGLGVLSPRLCCYCEERSLKISTFLFSSHLSSLIVFGGDKYSWLNDCTFISGLKHLTVLQLDGLLVAENFFDMKLPTQIRYLDVWGEFREIPASISSLSKLETLIVNNGNDKIRLPDTIWEIVTLRHLRGSAKFLLPEPRGRKLKNLQTLNFLCGAEVRIQALAAVPNLRNLNCTVGDLGCLLMLGFLSQLESLRLDFTYSAAQLSNLDMGILPSNLRKLTIERTVFNKHICRLPNLEVLKMVSVIYRQGKWCMTDYENFRKLKYFELVGSDIAIWNASSENFPCLEKLVLGRCYALESIPLSFGEIPTLQLIDVWLVGQSVVSSAKQIQEDQKSLGNEELKVKV